LSSYFASPIAYVVIGFYALMFGYFFYALLVFFDRQGMQMAGFGGAMPMNGNESLIAQLAASPASATARSASCTRSPRSTASTPGGQALPTAHTGTRHPISRPRGHTADD
jgi:hypothetical protein